MKTASKRKTTSRKKKPELKTCEQERCFWSNHGPIACNLKELLFIVENETNDAQFSYHVNPERNDYALWVREVLGERACATALGKSKKRDTFLKALRTALKKYA